MKTILAVATLLSLFTNGVRAEPEPDIGFGPGHTLDTRSFLKIAAAQASKSNAPQAAPTGHTIVVVSGDPANPVTVTVKSAETTFVAGDPGRRGCGDTRIDAGISDVFEPYLQRRRVANAKSAAAIVSQPAPDTYSFSARKSLAGGRCAFGLSSIRVELEVRGSAFDQTVPIYLDLSKHGRYAGNYHLVECRRQTTMERTRDKYRVPLNVTPNVINEPDGPVFECEETTAGVYCQIDLEEYDGRVRLTNGAAHVPVGGAESETRITFDLTKRWADEIPDKPAHKTYGLSPISYPDAVACEEARSTFAKSWGNTLWVTFGMEKEDSMASCAAEGDKVVLHAHIRFSAWRGEGYLPKTGDTIPFSGTPPVGRSYPIGAPDFHYALGATGTGIDPALEATMKDLLVRLSSPELRMSCGEFSGTNSWRSCPVRFEFLE